MKDPGKRITSGEVSQSSEDSCSFVFYSFLRDVNLQKHAHGDVGDASSTQLREHLLLSGDLHFRYSISRRESHPGDSSERANIRSADFQRKCYKEARLKGTDPAIKIEMAVISRALSPRGSPDNEYTIACAIYPEYIEPCRAGSPRAE